MSNSLVLALLLLLVNSQAFASLGDSFPSYKSCVDTCKLEYCEKDGYHYKIYDTFSASGMFQWRCSDDCRYRCMWTIVDNFERKGWPPPQFHGKWPFVRWLSLQEPASVIFSLLNLAVHVIMFRKFRTEVRPSSPMYKVWFLYAGVCINCWVWSAIFHARDLPLTELMDYLSAFGMVFYSLYGMIMRVLISAPAGLSVLVTLVFISFFINHAGYLVLGQFDYQYNMSANIAVVYSRIALCLGILSAGVSAVWSLASWRQMNHSKYLASVVVLGLLTTLFEVSDFPPYMWTFDAHALWHLSTIPIPYFFWRFVIEDCKHLRKTMKER